MLAIDLILDIIEPYDMVLAMGHISISESKPLVTEARNIGIQHVVLSTCYSHVLLDQYDRRRREGGS